MVSLRCKMVVKEELKKLGLHFIVVDLGEIEIMEDITDAQREELKNALISRALKSPFSYYIIVDLVKHSFYQVNNLYFKFEPKR